MTERQSHHANGAPETLQDWPTLVSRAVDNVTRILQSEAHMLQTSIGATLETRLASAIATLTVMAVMLCGGVSSSAPRYCCSINGCRCGSRSDSRAPPSCLSGSRCTQPGNLQSAPIPFKRARRYPIEWPHRSL